MIDPANWFLVFARAGALLSIFPLTSAQNVPVRVRVALGALVAFLVAPLLPAPPPGLTSVWSLVGVLFLEISVGLLLGFICRLVFFAVEMAGSIIATDLGLMMSSNFNPLSNNVATAPSMILYWLAMMLLVTLDLHHWVLAAFQRTYELLPIGSARLSEALLTDVISRTGGIFLIAVRIAAPMMATSFVIMIIFSVLGSAMPQMNVFSESFPVRTLAGLTVFGLTCNLMAQHIAAYLHRIPEDMVRIAHLLRG